MLLFQSQPNPQAEQQRHQPPRVVGEEEMTQKQNLFKGKSKKKSVPPSRHGKVPHIRKGTDGDGSASCTGFSSVALSRACSIDQFVIGCAGKRL